jgi:abnormal spindle-like microcephaly-associated protein
MCTARGLFRRQRAAAAVVQAAWRALLAGCAARGALLAQHLAATVAQAAWRGGRQRASFVALRMAAVQASSRLIAQTLRRQGRTWCGSRSCRVSAGPDFCPRSVQVQAAARMCVCRRAFRRQRGAAVAIQAAWRAAVAREHVRRAAAAMQLQRRVRGCLARRRLRMQQSAAQLLQAHIRGHQARRRCYQQA